MCNVSFPQKFYQSKTCIYKFFFPVQGSILPHISMIFFLAMILACGSSYLMGFWTPLQFQLNWRGVWISGHSPLAWSLWWRTWTTSWWEINIQSWFRFANHIWLLTWPRSIGQSGGFAGGNNSSSSSKSSCSTKKNVYNANIGLINPPGVY